MAEFFIHSSSFAAPFFGDEGHHYVTGDTPEGALTAFAASYSHPAGLFAADIYENADAFHKGRKRLARWLSNKARIVEERTSTGAHGIYSKDASTVEIDGEEIKIEDPKGGCIVHA